MPVMIADDQAINCLQWGQILCNMHNASKICESAIDYGKSQYYKKKSISKLCKQFKQALSTLNVFRYRNGQSFYDPSFDVNTIQCT